MSCLWHVLLDRPHSHLFFGLCHWRGGGFHQESELNPLWSYMSGALLMVSCLPSCLLQTKPRSLSPGHSEVSVLTFPSFLSVPFHSTLKQSIIWKAISILISLKELFLRNLNLCMAFFVTLIRPEANYLLECG